MKRLNLYLTILLLCIVQLIYADGEKTDANLIGHVVSKGEHIPFVTISIKGTTVGTTTDETGHYQLINIPEGTHILRAQSMGYKPQDTEISISTGETKEVHFELQEDVLGLEEVVITGNRNETNRKDASTIVNTITPKMFSRTQSVTLSEGLNFSPGLRLENNCQNCGSTQIRMNGMEGSYSQILINSRPIFGGLAGVYGLELIPSNMIDRVEVIRGGGSALYGSNAIAGTINLILKDPIQNSYELGINSSLIGIGLSDSADPVPDNSINLNTSLVSSDHKTGMAVYGFYRNRKPFDANNDSFSEIALLKNTTFGGRFFHRFSTKSKLSADFFSIWEKRRGGDKFENLPHQTGITEAVEHNITTGALTWEHFISKTSLLSVYASGQRINRDSYYGADYSLSDYGNTKSRTYSVGAQYNNQFGISKLVVGIENKGEWLDDTKLGYPDLDNATSDSIPQIGNTTIANQKIYTQSVFTQYDIKWNKFDFSLGIRYDHYKITDIDHEDSDKIGDVLSPRFTIKYDIKSELQARASYSQGYRAPQIFDEDLHIETSGSRQVIHENDPGLKQETSHSIMASLDYNKLLGKVYFGLLVEGFYNRLNDAFVTQIGIPDEEGTVIYTRTNAEAGAIVNGINIEMNLVPSNKISFKAGFTVQSSKYEEPQDFDEEKFLRTPNDYGYLMVDWQTTKTFGISATGNYTGKMLIPYFGPNAADPETGELRQSNPFFDLGLKIRYNIKMKGATLQLFSGIKNIFNSYQSDFDYGINRDPGYVYGPLNPRTIYFGLKIGNMIGK